MKFKIAQEVADADFVRLCDANRIDHDTTDLNEEDLASWKEMRDAIVRDLRLGTLIVNAEGRPVYTPPGGTKSYTFRAPTGASFMALETHPKAKGIANTFAAMADLTGESAGEFSKMAIADMHAMMRVSNLFLVPR